jgi:hypothetical protein
MALTILAHYCVVLFHSRGHWWIGNFGIQVLKEICYLLGSDGLSRINWAIDATGICLARDGGGGKVKVLGPPQIDFGYRQLFSLFWPSIREPGSARSGRGDSPPRTSRP